MNDLPNSELIRFGIWHNYINNYDTRIKPCPRNCNYGSLIVDGKYVAEEGADGESLEAIVTSAKNRGGLVIMREIVSCIAWRVSIRTQRQGIQKYEVGIVWNRIESQVTKASQTMFDTLRDIAARKYMKHSYYPINAAYAIVTYERIGYLEGWEAFVFGEDD